MYEIRIENKSFKTIEFIFLSDFINFIPKNKIVFQKTNLFKSFDIIVSETSLKKIFDFVLSKDSTLQYELNKFKKIKIKIPLEFNINNPYRFLLAQIIFYKNLNFLYSYQNVGINFLSKKERCILADDMGLGKTIQTLIAADKLIKKEECKCNIIVCPNSLITNWKSEIAKWTPFLKCEEINNNDFNDKSEIKKKIFTSNFLIINYEKIPNLKKFLETFQYTFSLVIADEAHRLRGNTSKVAYNFKKIKSDKCWLLSGTPFENNLDDLRNIISILDLKTAHSKRDFSLTFLNSILRKYTLRRMKSDVLKDLPKKHKHIQLLDFNSHGKKEYKKILKQISLLSKDNKIGYFSKLLNICIENKFERSQEIIENFLSSRRKIIVFSYLTKPLEKLLNYLPNEISKQSLLLTGKLTKEERDQVLKKFKNAELNKNILFLSSFLGSVGLTLTNANVALFLSEYWNPSANAQAEDRLFRIGQKKDVDIISLRIKNSVEENLESILTSKTSINKKILKCLEEEEKKLSLIYSSS